MNCGWMNSHETERLAGSELYQVGDWSKIRTQQSRPTPIPIDNVGSLHINIHVEIYD